MSVSGVARLLVLLGLGGVACEAEAEADSGTGPREGDAGVRGLLIAQSWDHVHLTSGEGAGKYRVISLQESMFSELPAIREANPDALLLAYQKVGGMRADGEENPSTGIRVDQAVEEFFLHDTAGNRLTYCDYTEVFAADPGHLGYQAAWLAAVSERLLRDGFDGVMMDDVNTFPGHCLGSLGTPIAEYPNDAAYGDAVVDFMASVGPGLIAAGLAVAPNVGMNPWDETMLAQSVAMMPYMTHFSREYWMRWDDSANFRGSAWESTLETMVIAQAEGVAYLAVTKGPGEEGAVEGQRYGRASWLLAWDGASDSAWGYWGGGEEPFGPDWEPDIGLPMEEAVQVDGVWRREYDRGLVLVNPSEEEVGVALGETLTDPELGEVDRITLGAGQGRVLVR